MKKLLLLFFIAVLFFSFGNTAKAQLIASESFNYNTGNITGDNGGTGWSSAWLTTTFNSSNTTIATAGLTMPPQVVGVGNQNHQVGNDFRNFRYLDTTSSQALSLMDNNGDPGATANTNYHWGKGYGKDGTTIWFSFLFYRSNNTQGYGGMHLMYGMDLNFDQYGNKMAHQRFQFGADNSHANYMLSRTINGNPNLSGCGVTVQGTTPVNGTLHLIVVRIDFKPGAERVFQWIDPLSCTTPDTAVVDTRMSACDFRFNAVNIGAGSNANFEFDELRIGLTYNDVVNCSTGLNYDQMSSAANFAFPNPNNGNFNLNFISENHTNGTIIVSDVLGQTILQRNLEFEMGENEIPFNVEGIQPGIYFITLKTDEGIAITQRLIIQVGNW
jgi:hypothetical protein